ncbi:class I SAM-dependent methyltransferase [Clostridium estertheticum]|uniref:class I SAM-dependent methyltransferase n=1 Tax=Clostridium estertheticum TaxID=238834 RepID=UPI001CF2186F|nr:class I SAM-dependent methyltransferase [Clostridium estertheticum]MCB2356393.1 class I SAM-dependent methyltransferase [Clostridium estertheticum]WAG39659.1 class I SAM-dependent methyltransferase [Clostridium estertheticum]
MNITKYVAGQFGKPTGIGGVISTFIMNRMNQIQYKSVVSNLNCCKNDRVLDIGFGNGYLLNLLAKKNEGGFYGIEISDDMLKAGYKRNKELIKQRKIHLAVGNVMDIPFENYFFDKVYTVNTVYFWKDLDKSLSEIRRVLKPNGIFINAIYSKQWLDNIKYTQYGFLKYTPKELEEATLRNGLNVIKVIETKKNISYCIISRIT